MVNEGERGALRAELRRRILLQNGLLMLAVVLFAAFGLAVAARSIAGPGCAAALNVALLALSAQWCHHGVRTAQIKAHLLMGDPDADGWERWLRRNRPRTLLGSRWLVSTKGVFLGLGAAGALLWVPGAARGGVDVVVVAATWLTSAYLLLTNVKE